LLKSIFKGLAPIDLRPYSLFAVELALMAEDAKEAEADGL